MAAKIVHQRGDRFFPLPRKINEKEKKKKKIIKVKNWRIAELTWKVELVECVRDPILGTDLFFLTQCKR